MPWCACTDSCTDAGELVVLERKGKRLVYRMGRSFDRSSFSAQPACRDALPGRNRGAGREAFLRELLKASPRVRRLCIDLPAPRPRICSAARQAGRHGIGMNLAENLQTEFRSRVEGLALIGQVKEGLAVDLKIAFPAHPCLCRAPLCVAPARAKRCEAGGDATGRRHGRQAERSEAGGENEAVAIPRDRELTAPIALSRIDPPLLTKTDPAVFSPAH